MSKSTNKKSVLTVVFGIITVLFACCFILSVYNVTTYIRELVSSGSISVSSSIMDIVLYYMNNCSGFLAYTVFSFGFFCIFYSGKKAVVDSKEEIIDINEDIQEVKDDANDE